MKSLLFASASLPLHVGGEAWTTLPIIEQLFDHIPETAFFIKDRGGRYLAVNQSLVERCGLEEKQQLIGRHVREIFPQDLADLYASQDQAVLKTGRAIIDHLELHWYAHRRPGWCLTTKLAIRDSQGDIAGIAGISRDLRAPGDSETIPAKLGSTLEYLESHYSEPISPGSMARLAGLPPVRFARLIKRIFRLTPNQLITQTRLAAAARLLIETRRSVADIACACGFYDHSALTRAFRSAANMTPSKFRLIAAPGYNRKSHGIADS
ncbi:MAG TPA: AraC family transcriptional regulator [Verrucomicrobiae bacterium]|nr:AraC family transcriptional regulator [Verrucomicrobiae bacterium]